MAMDSENKARDYWNKFADANNKWVDLGQYERDALIMRQIVREFVDCYFGRNYRRIKDVVEDACTILSDQS